VVYAQANGTVVFDQMQTMHPWVSGIAKRNLRNADNNYVTGDATVGFSIDRNTTGMIQATYYRANNFDAAYAAVGMPLGASAKESTITVGVRRKLSEKTLLSAKIGYFDSQNATRGGFADFRGPLGYLSVQQAF
jgi:putative ribosome biogenesis GTPase RsgA